MLLYYITSIRCYITSLVYAVILHHFTVCQRNQEISQPGTISPVPGEHVFQKIPTVEVVGTVSCFTD